jgi:hypothetical protein
LLLANFLRPVAQLENQKGPLGPFAHRRIRR